MSSKVDGRLVDALELLDEMYPYVAESWTKACERGSQGLKERSTMDRYLKLRAQAGRAQEQLEERRKRRIAKKQG